MAEEDLVTIELRWQPPVRKRKYHFEVKSCHSQSSRLRALHLELLRL